MYTSWVWLFWSFKVWIRLIENMTLTFKRKRKYKVNNCGLDKILIFYEFFCQWDKLWCLRTILKNQLKFSKWLLLLCFSRNTRLDYPQILLDPSVFEHFLMRIFEILKPILYYDDLYWHEKKKVKTLSLSHSTVRAVARLRGSFQRGPLIMTLWSISLKVQSEIKRKWRSWTVNRYFAVDLKHRHPSLASSGVNGGTQLSILSKSSSQIRMSSLQAETPATWATAPQRTPTPAKPTLLPPSSPWPASTTRCLTPTPTRTRTKSWWKPNWTAATLNSH